MIVMHYYTKDSPRELRVLVCGSRTWRDVEAIENALTALVERWATELRTLVVIDGDGPGADRIAGRWAGRSANRYAAGATVPVIGLAFPADWQTHGRAAGPIRNQRMVNQGHPDLVLAFVDRPLDSARGTADMVRRARTAGIPVQVHRGTGTVTAGEVIDLADEIPDPDDGACTGPEASS